MIILGADTSCNRASCALWIDGKIIESTSGEDKRKHSETFMPMVAALMEQNKIQPKDLDLLAVTSGPGSFTGLRIGMASIKGMAYTLGIKIATATSLDILANGVKEYGGTICPIIDARNRQVYTALYKKEQKGVKRISEYMGIKIEDLAERLLQAEQPIHLCGDASPQYYEFFTKQKNINCAQLDKKGIYPSAAVLVEMAAKQTQGISIADPAEVVPYYLRKSQAERLYGKK